MYIMQRTQTHPHAQARRLESFGRRASEDIKEKKASRATTVMIIGGKMVCV
jgi:hypothetical protein